LAKLLSNATDQAFTAGIAEHRFVVERKESLTREVLIYKTFFSRSRADKMDKGSVGCSFRNLDFSTAIKIDVSLATHLIANRQVV